MNDAEKARLLYRRQYVLSPNSVNCPFIHRITKINDSYTLFSHVDLPVTDISNDACRLILLGDIFSFENPKSGNAELLQRVADPDLTSFLMKVSWYAGRFVIIYMNATGIFLLHDAASARKIYYHCLGDIVYCASQPNLLAKILKLEPTTDPSKVRFYQSARYEKLNNANIGNTTRYDGIFQLIPNHYLAFDPFKIVRYWPNKPMEIRPLAEVVSQCSKMIEGYIKGISHRYSIMLPVTAGKDSRLLFAATRSIRDKVFYYINKEKHLHDYSFDIIIPKTLLKKLGVKFSVIEPYIPIDKDFEEVFIMNNPYNSKRYFPLIYNYYANYSDKVNLPGIFINAIEDVYEYAGEELQPEDLAGFIHVEEYDYAIDYFSSWLKGCHQLCKSYNLNVLNLLYWEERVANWGTQTQLDKDIAQEDIVPYNSRMLIEILLSADLRYRDKPDFTVFKEVMRLLWPETLQAPFNPGFKDIMLKLTKSLGIMYFVKRIYYSYVKK